MNKVTIMLDTHYLLLEEGKWLLMSKYTGNLIRELDEFETKFVDAAYKAGKASND